MDFLLPVHQRLAAEIKVPVILHICGNTGDRIGMIAQTGLNCFHWDTKTGEPGRGPCLAGQRLALMGGISNFTLLRGTPDECSPRPKRLAKRYRRGRPGIAIPLATPLANLKAIAFQEVSDI